MLPKNKKILIEKKTKKAVEEKREYSSKPIFEVKIIRYLFEKEENIANKTSITLTLRINQTKLDQYLERLIEKNIIKTYNVGTQNIIIKLTDDGKKIAQEIKKLVDTNHPIIKLSVFTLDK